MCTTLVCKSINILSTQAISAAIISLGVGSAWMAFRTFSSKRPRNKYDGQPQGKRQRSSPPLFFVTDKPLMAHQQCIQAVTLLSPSFWFPSTNTRLTPESLMPAVNSLGQLSSRASSSGLTLSEIRLAVQEAQACVKLHISPQSGADELWPIVTYILAQAMASHPILLRLPWEHVLAAIISDEDPVLFTYASIAVELPQILSYK